MKPLKLVSIGGAFVAALVFFLLALFISYNSYITTQKDKDIFQNGIETSGSIVRTHCFGKLFLMNCDLDVAYVGAHGVRKMVNIPAGVFFGGLYEEANPVFKYDKYDDGNVSVSLLANHVAERRITAFSMSLLIILLGSVAGIRSGMTVLGQYLSLKRIARDPNPIACRILSVQLKTFPGYAKQYLFEYETMDGLRQGKQVFPVIQSYSYKSSDDFQYRTPIFLDGENMVALGLLGNDKMAVLISDNFDPLIMSDQEKGNIVALAELDRHAINGSSL